MKTLIVGGGIAGTTCAEELRKLLPEAEITIISEEETPLYSRVLLPHYLKGKVPRERVFLKTQTWYEEQNISVVEARAEKIDLKNNFVATSDARELPFDKLVIASGRYTRDIPEYERGVAYLWTLGDADHLLQLISEQSRPSKVGVYGGGLIACEFLNIFKNYNFDITVAFRGPYFWSRVLDEESGRLINQHLEKQGIKVLPEAKFVGLNVGTNGLPIRSSAKVGRLPELENFQTDKGEIPCKILGVGIGLEPDLSWLADSGIKTEKGIMVNEKLETNLPNVYAIGDTAEVYDIFSGHHRVMGTWTAAQTQGRIAAKNIAGENKVFDQIITSTMSLLGLDVIFIGDNDRNWADEIKIEGSVAEGGVVQIFYKNGKVIGATLVNRNEDRKRLLGLFQ
ncbi:MAG: FAD-dependent oxidoreductase [Candidatus Uhrbacteria bacterium]